MNVPDPRCACTLSTSSDIPATCPNCGRGRGGDGVHANGVSVWCVGCGWGRNR